MLLMQSLFNIVTDKYSLLIMLSLFLSIIWHNARDNNNNNNNIYLKSSIQTNSMDYI